MKRTLEYTRDEWKDLRTIVCSIPTLYMLVFWFLKARPRTFACCILALCFLLPVSTGSAFAKTVTVDAQGWVDFYNVQVTVDLKEYEDKVLEYAVKYNENAVVDKYLAMIAEKNSTFPQPAAAWSVLSVEDRRKTDLLILDLIKNKAIKIRSTQENIE